MGVPIGVCIPIGPHPREPHELEHVMESEAGPGADKTTLAAGRAEWLAEVLDQAGVVLGDGDREIIAVLSYDRPSVVQVVAGWVARSIHPIRSR